MAKKTAIEIPFKAATNGFPVNHYFNRFFIEKEDEGALVHLGYQGSTSYLMGAFSFFIPYRDIERLKESILLYIDALDFGGEEQEQIFFPQSERPVHSVRFLHAGRTAEHAELLLYNIPVFQEVEIRKDPENSIVADPLAAFSSPIPTHVSLLKQIFAG